MTIASVGESGKRVFDATASSIALICLSLVLALVALLIKREDGGPVFYKGTRVGRYGQRFRMYKFRTMVINGDRIGGPSTANDDPRITRVGRCLRRTKLDELPQLLNVVRGEMSIVGPRPEVPYYTDMYTEEEKAILSVRPGITDLATLWNAEEGEVLAASTDPERTYLEKIRPEKIRLQLEYVRRQSFRTDLWIIWQTILTVVLRREPKALGVLSAARSRPPGPEVSPRVFGVPAITSDLLKQLYRTMVRIRLTEERLAALVEAGEVKTPCHLYIGQEAIAAGVCAALLPTDYVWGGHRSHGHYLAQGGDLRAMISEILGKATGCSGGRGGSMHLFAGEVGLLGTVPLVAATIPLAVGAGLAGKLRNDGRVSVAFFGDGATEEGHFHESVNMAALYRLPVVFVCENNFYASHMQLLERRVADNLTDAARAHGIPGLRLDGNDVVGVLTAATEAVARARAGGGPTLVECRTYRWRGHVGPSWDDDVGVKRKDELKHWLPRDPIKRTKERLQEMGVDGGFFEAVHNDVLAEVEEAVAFARSSPLPPESDLLRYVFA